GLQPSSHLPFGGNGSVVRSCSAGHKEGCNRHDKPGPCLGVHHHHGGGVPRPPVEADTRPQQHGPGYSPGWNNSTDMCTGVHGDPGATALCPGVQVLQRRFHDLIAPGHRL
ncbi:unnamed protein product, partial [Ectocarpus sp. 12 AP-2014]